MQRWKIICGTSAVVGVIVAVCFAYGRFRARNFEREYCRGIVEEANGRWIVLNGVLDFRFREVAPDAVLISRRGDERERLRISGLVDAEYPAFTNLHVAIQAGIGPFIDVLSAVAPDRIYVPPGSVTYDGWHSRWNRINGYLGHGYRSEKAIRRVFALDGISVADRLEKGGEKAKADEFRAFLRSEVDPVYFQMLDKRHAPEAEELKTLAKIGLKAFAEKSNTMIRSLENGGYNTAAKLAREIVDDPRFRSYKPANAVLGTVAFREKDYVSAETFFRIATAGTNETPDQVWRDYAETLRQLGKTNEAARVLAK